jgi:hypothetical protein
MQTWQTVVVVIGLLVWLGIMEVVANGHYRCRVPRKFKSWPAEKEWRKEHAKTCRRCTERIARIEAGVAELRRRRAAGMPAGIRYLPPRPEGHLEVVETELVA